MAGENGSGVKTNRVTPIIYLGITFTPSYYKQSNSLLSQASAKILWPLGKTYLGSWAFIFIYFKFFFRLLTFQGWRNKFVASWSNFTWGRGRGMADA
jgi:hypothetical protein